MSATFECGASDELFKRDTLMYPGYLETREVASIETNVEDDLEGSCQVVLVLEEKTYGG